MLSLSYGSLLLTNTKLKVTRTRWNIGQERQKANPGLQCYTDWKVSTLNFLKKKITLLYVRAVSHLCILIKQRSSLCCWSWLNLLWKYLKISFCFSISHFILQKWLFLFTYICTPFIVLSEPRGCFLFWNDCKNHLSFSQTYISRSPSPGYSDSLVQECAQESTFVKSVWAG